MLTAAQTTALRYLAAQPQGAAEGYTRQLPRQTVLALVKAGLVRCESFTWKRATKVSRARAYGGSYYVQKDCHGCTVHITDAGREAAK